MKAILSLFAVAISATAFAQLELTPPVVGPFSIKGHKLWSFGPLVNNEEFTIPAADPYNRVYVLTGGDASGFAAFEFFDGTDWRHLMNLGNRFPTAYFGAPRPGLILVPGRYRLTSTEAGKPSFVFGYLSPPTSTFKYSGMDEYPAQDKIWSVHSWLNGTEWTVPEGKVYVVTFRGGEEVQKKGSNDQWVPYLPANGSINEPGLILPLPGLRLPAGQYRFKFNSVGVIGGFITAES